MPTKDCKEYGDCERRSFFRRLFTLILLLIFLILLTILIIFLVLRPTKPRFSLQDASVYALNLSSANTYLLTTTLQVTLASRNPNNRIGVYYDKLDVYATYKSQQITLPSVISAVYQGHNDVTVWSPFLYGVEVPVAPYLCVSIAQDQNAGIVLLHVRVDGRLRWKVGSWISGRYHIHVNCPAFVSVENGKDGVATGFKFQQISECTVDV